MYRECLYVDEGKNLMHMHALLTLSNTQSQQHDISNTTPFKCYLYPSVIVTVTTFLNVGRIGAV